MPPAKNPMEATTTTTTPGVTKPSKQGAKTETTTKTFFEDEDVTENKPSPGVAIVSNPNVIPPDDVKFLRDELRLEVGKRLKRGRFGVVYDGEFLDNFTLDKFRKLKTMHFFLTKKTDLQQMKLGQKFAIKYCDIENRKAYNVVDIEERIKKEINFIKRVEMESCASIVNTYFVFALTPTRYYMVMELADNNLQCVISDLNRSNRLLEPAMVIEMYASLVRTIRSLHKQKLTYGMLRTSNVLAFYPKVVQSGTDPGAAAGAPGSTNVPPPKSIPKSSNAATLAAFAPKSGSSKSTQNTITTTTTAAVVAPKSNSSLIAPKSVSSAGAATAAAAASASAALSTAVPATTKVCTTTACAAPTTTTTTTTTAALAKCSGNSGYSSATISNNIGNNACAATATTTAKTDPSTITNTGVTKTAPGIVPKLGGPGSPSPSVGSISNNTFTLKIADFVNSVDGKATENSYTAIDEAIEQDLDDLFYIHYEIFALTRFDFAKYQAFKESLKIMTEINAHQDSVETLNKVVDIIGKFKRELPSDKIIDNSKPSSATS